MYAGVWRQCERWCQGRGIVVLPAPPEALAAFLAERAEGGLTFGTLDGYCSGIATEITKKASRTRLPMSSCDACAEDSAGSWESLRVAKPTHSPC